MLTAIFATVFIGSGAFLEAHSPLLVLTPLFLLFVSLILLKASLDTKFEPLLFVFGVVVFGLSIYIAPIRSSTHVFPAIAFVFLFLDKVSLKEKFIVSVGLLLTYYFSFFVFPAGIERKFLSLSEYQQVAKDFNPINEGGLFVKTVGSFIFTDDIEKLFFSKVSPGSTDSLRGILGSLSLFFIIVFVFRRKSGHQYSKVAIFSLVWILLFYLPYGIRSDSRFMSNHRYLLSVFPGVVLVWAIFSNYRYWKPVTILIILIGIIQSNIFFGSYLVESKKRSDFYSQLHQVTGSYPDGALVFFDFPDPVRNRAVDFFRVGYFPSEASLGTEFAQDYQKIKLITDSQILKKYLTLRNFEAAKFFSYYYDGETLINTTKTGRDLLASGVDDVDRNINKSQNTELLFDEKTKSWTGKNDGVKFSIDSFIPTIPSILSFEVRATVPEIPLPYTQGCANCIYDPSSVEKILSYLTKSKSLKESLVVAVSNSGEETFADSIIDNNEGTFWLSDRQLWFKAGYPTVEISLKNKEEIEGLILSSVSQIRRPKELRVLRNGYSIDFDVQTVDEKRLLILFKSSRLVERIAITILSTYGGDSPGIAEVDIIPKGFFDINIKMADRLENFPAQILKKGSDVDIFKKYLAAGGKACLIWDQKGYGKGQENMVIKVDGKRRIYNVELPAFGVGIPELTLGCLNYPVNIEVFSANVKYLNVVN